MKFNKPKLKYKNKKRENLIYIGKKPKKTLFCFIKNNLFKN